MKPGTSQDSKWTWLQMTQGPNHEAVKLQGPKQKMQELVQQVPYLNRGENDVEGPHAEGC
jgi:hypothetical protein